MASNISTAQTLRLYKSLISEAKKFSAYNFRSYALRRIRDAFKQNKNLDDNELIANKIAEGYSNLEIIKRQALISQLYRTDKLVIEK